MLLQYFLSDLKSYISTLNPYDQQRVLDQFFKEYEILRTNNAELNEEQLLEKFGLPLQTAFRICASLGIKANLRRKNKTAKYVLRFILITFGFFIAGMGYLVWRYTPIFTIDESQNRVQLFGNTIILDGNNNTLKLGDHILTDQANRPKIEGNISLNELDLNSLIVEFKNTDISINQNNNNQVTWTCDVPEKVNENFIEHNQDSKSLKLSLETLMNTVCDISVPANLYLDLKIDSGRATFNALKNSLTLKMDNGLVSFAPDATTVYEYNIQIENGQKDVFDSTDSEYKVSIELENGKIVKLPSP